MQRRTPTTAAIESIRSTMTASGVNEVSVAEATDIALEDLNARLNGTEEFTVAEMVLVGGFLHLPLTQLFAEAA